MRGSLLLQPRMRPLCAGLAAAALLLAPVAAGRAWGQGATDHIDITAVAIEGKTAELCAERLDRVVEQARKLSLATRPPHDLSDGLRGFYDQTLRLDPNGELASTAVLSTAYVQGYRAGGDHDRRSAAAFMRVEVSRPAGTPAGAPSQISASWLWMQRIAPGLDTAGRPIERPNLHRFDFVGELEPSYGVWGHAVARCRLGGERQWFGAVMVWTYLPP